MVEAMQKSGLGRKFGLTVGAIGDVFLILSKPIAGVSGHN